MGGTEKICLETLSLPMSENRIFFRLNTKQADWMIWPLTHTFMFFGMNWNVVS